MNCSNPDVPGPHSEGLPAVGPAPTEVQVADAEEVEQVHRIAGGDSLTAGEREDEGGGDEEQGKEEEHVIGDGGEPAKDSHRPGTGALPCHRPDRVRPARVCRHRFPLGVTRQTSQTAQKLSLGIS